MNAMNVLGVVMCGIGGLMIGKKMKMDGLIAIILVEIGMFFVLKF